VPAECRQRCPIRKIPDYFPDKREFARGDGSAGVLQSGIEERVICSRGRKAGTPAVVFRAMQAAVHEPSRSACESGFREIATLLRKDPTTGGVCRERAGLTFGSCSFAPSLMEQVLTALNWDLAAHLNIECHRCFAKSRRFPLCTKCHLLPSVAARRR
jgi:hypothetical protein